jgi:hypothetical protein
VVWMRERAELEAGDILLYRSDTWTAKAIRLLDGTEVSHAGLYLGGGFVGEALAVGEHAGLGTQPLADSMAGCDWVAVRRLGTTAPTMEPVMGTARRYLDQGNDYAYGQILLLAMICATRKLDLSNPLLRRIVYAAINNAAAFVRWMQSGGKQPMICSEFVYRSYDEAIFPDKDDSYTIEIEPVWSGAPGSAAWRVAPRSPGVRRLTRCRSGRTAVPGDRPPRAFRRAIPAIDYGQGA